MRRLPLIGTALAALLLGSADAQQICCSGGGGSLPTPFSATSLTAHGVVVGEGGSPVDVTAAGSTGQCLLSGGPSTDPAWGSCSGGSGVSFPLQAPNGSASAPSYSFSGAASSGMFAPANGNVQVVGASGGTNAGIVSLQGGTPTSGNSAGGNVNLTGGAQTGTSGNGGYITLTGGVLSSSAGTNANGGEVVLTGGADGAGNSNRNYGGNVVLTGGAAANSNGSGEGGSIELVGGAGTNGNAGGSIIVNPGTAANGASGFAFLTAGSTTIGQQAWAYMAGRINAALSAVGNGSDTTEDTLQSYSVVAGAFDQSNRCVRITAWGTLASNGDTKTIRVYFGANAISSGGLTASGATWLAHMLVCKNGTNSQNIVADMTVGTTAIAPYYAAGTNTDTAAITIKTTGQAGAANAGDIVCQGQYVEYLS